MAERTLEVHALSPLLFRDGRPFGAAEGTETSARSLPTPLPSTLAGFIRTQIGTGLGWDWSEHRTLQNAHGIGVYGPLLTRDGHIVLPAPRDAVIYDNEEGTKVMRLTPWPTRLPDGAGTDAPDGLTPLQVTEDVKPSSGFDFWTQIAMTDWLLGNTPEKLERIGALPLETRTHVGIDSGSLRAQEGMLYSVNYRSLESNSKRVEATTRWEKDHHVWTIRARATIPNGEEKIERIGFLGGERRPSTVKVLEYGSWFSCPNALQDVLKGAQRVRLILATPAIFEHGWKPGWLERTDEPNQPAGLGKVKLKLLSAAVGRREPVSGWSIRNGNSHGAKPVRWMVPAGSVYFFEIERGNPEHLIENWLKPVSDNEQDRKDGFGLALWGVW